MRAILLVLILAVALAPSARAQTYVPGQSPAAQSLQQQPLPAEQPQAVQLQQQQEALAAQPGFPGRQAQIQTNQAQIRQLQQDYLAAQMQQQQQQRQQLQQSLTPPPAS